jgi:hypothetical protein
MPLSPRTLRPSNNAFTPRSISGLALWLDAADTSTLYTTDAGAVTAVASPLDIAGCALWLDASDAGSITQSSGLVSQWNDKSGNTRHATASGSNRPTLTAAAQNGRAVLAFDGTANQMQIDSTFLVTSNATIFAVARRTSGSFGAVITSKGTGDTSPALQHASGAWQIGHSVNLSIIGATAGHAVLSGTISAGATAAYANGLIQDSDASSGTLSSDATKTYIGTYRAAIANVLAGEIAEIIVYPTALSNTDRARVEAYLAAKWGISGVHAPATATSDPVGAWLDKSGNARHATQSTAGSRPTISPVLRNGRRQLSFDGSDDRLILGNLSAAFPSAAELLVVMNNMGDTAYEVYSTRVGSSGASNSGFGTLTFPGAFRTERLGIGQTFISYSDRVFLWGIQSSAASYSVSVDGLVQLTDSGNFNGGESHVVGAQSTVAGVNGSLLGRVLEVVAYNKTLSESERRRLVKSLAAKWSIALPPQVSNADAQDWINRVYANGGTVSASTAVAVNQFCIDTLSIRDRFLRLNLHCGGVSGNAIGINSAMVPLYRGTSIGSPVGFAIDDNKGPFLGGDYAENSGLTGNGTSRHLDTGLAPSALPSYTSAHVAVYHSQPSGTNQTRVWVGCRDTAAASQIYLSNGMFSTSAVFGQYMSNATANFNTGGSQTGAAGGFRVLSRTAVDRIDNYYNAVSQANSPSDISGGLAGVTSTRPFFIFANNNQGTADSFMNGRLMGYSIGLGLSQAQVDVYNAAMQAFQTAMGRTV